MDSAGANLETLDFFLFRVSGSRDAHDVVLSFRFVIKDFLLSF